MGAPKEGLNLQGLLTAETAVANRNTLVCAEITPAAPDPLLGCKEHLLWAESHIQPARQHESPHSCHRGDPRTHVGPEQGTAQPARPAVLQNTLAKPVLSVRHDWSNSTHAPVVLEMLVLGTQWKKTCHVTSRETQASSRSVASPAPQEEKSSFHEWIRFHHQKI